MASRTTNPLATRSPSTPRRERSTSLLRRVQWFALAIFLLVTLIGVLALHAVHTLKESSDTLLQLALPLQRDSMKLDELQRRAEFYRRLAEILPGQGYEQTSQALIHREQLHLQALLPKLQKHPHIAQDVSAVLNQLQRFANEPLTRNTQLDTEQNQLDAKLDTLRQDLFGIFQQQADRATAARRRASWLIFTLIALTAGLAILVSWRVAVGLSRPLRTIRRALDALAQGQSAAVAETGPTELRAVASSIVQMQERLQEEEKLRHLFLSQVSHELKTPLASARSGSELLLSERLGSLTPRQREVLEIISRQVQELYLAIQEMLDLHALKARRLDYQIASVDSAKILQEAAARIGPQLEQKEQTLILQIQCRAMVLADPQRLLQIFANLLSNAHKYAPAKSLIELGVDMDGAEIHFWVRDQGPGIPQGLLEKVFEDFYQVQDHHRLAKGTGLGLSITRELLAAQNGRIRLRNASPGLMAEFWLPGKPGAQE
ncbi:MAG: HAMP domain-containing histidine kinase [Acidithiobacillus sp.]|nr:HAMP domain-containing histidine kinase [Acidithiobacillus sp.]